MLTYFKIDILTTAAYYTRPNDFKYVLSGFILDCKFRKTGVPELLDVANWFPRRSVNFHL